MTTRSEIERLVDELGYATIDDIQDLNKCKSQLMSAIDRVLAERDRANQRYLANKAILNEELAERDARIAALEKALTDIRDEADVYELELTETNVRMRLRAIFNTSRNALATEQTQ